MTKRFVDAWQGVTQARVEGGQRTGWLENGWLTPPPRVRYKERVQGSGRGVVSTPAPLDRAQSSIPLVEDGVNCHLTRSNLLSDCPTFLPAPALIPGDQQNGNSHPKFRGEIPIKSIYFGPSFQKNNGRCVPKFFWL